MLNGQKRWMLLLVQPFLKWSAYDDLALGTFLLLITLLRAHFDLKS